jgi:Kef-type K+ transport system membrane component KefB
VFLIVAGALLDVPTLWLLPAALLLAAVRVAARWAAVRYGRGANLGLARVAQGGVALGLASSFTLIYAGSSAGSTILTTVLIGVMVAQAIAAPLMALALRPAPPEVT